MITVVMTTYFTPDVPKREEYARLTVESLKRHLNSEDKLTLMVSDDSAESNVITHELICMGWKDSCSINSSHRGIGASLNNAMRHLLDTDYWMYTTDDWVLEAPLCLDGPMKLLRDRDYDLVRLGPIHPNLPCITRFDQSVGWWLELQPHYGGFAFSTRPFLATKEFYNKVGPFDEMLNSYETERLYAERVARSTCRLAYWGSVSLSGPWYHVGTECVGYMEVI